SARVFFQSSQRKYLVMDTPGHMEFLKNMVTGSAAADAALFVVDAREGLRENSIRHARMLSLLGVRDVLVLINKMDIVDFDRARFEELRAEIGEFMSGVGIEPLHYLPVSGRDGDGLATSSSKMPWFDGPVLLEALDELAVRKPVEDAPFRMPVQDVYKFTERGDDRRIVAGRIESGTLKVGDQLIFYPSEKTARVATLENFGPRSVEEFRAGQSAGFTLDQPLYLRRGELAVKAAEPQPLVATELRVNLFWLGRNPLAIDRDYLLKLGAAKVNVRLTAIEKIIDASTLEARDSEDGVGRFEVAQCVLSLDRPIAFDSVAGSGSNSNSNSNSISGYGSLSRFVIVDDFEIRGGGIIREAVFARASADEKPRTPSASGEVLRTPAGAIFTEDIAAAFYGIGCEI
ncbi:MAG: GTP-binding protein, partial [Bdellovibrionia bacterium]